ncbi:protein FAM161B-like isoform X2 [Cyprinus carpio]|uniref:Protein FAM161B-like isoform X2 n=1 Tax=Cyprinus carpio TaxID=7962 RepID=A0A9Q9Z2P6_CYPCA|nr:protein FAM161B-like isoform X2 [Cyprinus carpio]
MNLKRSSSFGGLTSLSMDTLPTYITDAARKRSMAVRRSLELKDLKEQENAKWMKQHRIKSQPMSRAVAMRAQAMDPHKEAS